MNGCSALNLSPCFAPVTNWWQSIEAWWPWVEFGVACLAILVVLGLVQRVFGWGGVVAAMGGVAYAIGYFRGRNKERFNPLPDTEHGDGEPLPQPVAQPAVTPGRTIYRHD